MDRLPYYVSADAAHYLADADALLGHGVRESRHLPLFPLVLGLTRFLFGTLGGVVAAMLVVLALLVLGFHFLVRDRLGSPAAEAVGALFFVASPLMAEAVGWYGASMLLGLALSLIAMRMVDDALASPTVATAVKAGLVCGLVGLCHPLSFLLLAQVCGLVVPLLVITGARAARRSGLPVGRWLRPRLLAVTGILCIAVVVTLPALRFYTELRSPIAIAFDPARLGALGRWAFRQDAPFWAALLALSTVILVPGARRLSGDAGGRLAVWALGFSIVPLGTVLLLGGHPSYTSRYLYALPVILATTAAVGFDLLWRTPPHMGPSGVIAVRVLVAIAVCVSALRVAESYVSRVDIALAYYNPLTPSELEAVRWLHDRPGTVAVSAKGGDMVSGTLYAWRIEGLAHTRAIGTDQAFLAVLDSAHRDSVDVDRIFAGSIGLEDGRMRVAASESDVEPIRLNGLVGGDWFPLAELGLAPISASPGGAPVMAAVKDDHGVLSLDHGGLAVEAEVSSRSPAETVITIRRRAGAPEPLTADLRPPESARSATLRSDGGTLSADVDVNGRRMTVEVQGDGAIARVDRDARTGSARLHLEAAPSADTMTFTVRATGLDPVRTELSSYRDVDLLQRHDVRYLYTWRQSALAPVLSARACFEPAAQNAEVVIFRVRASCIRPAGSGSSAAP